MGHLQKVTPKNYNRFFDDMENCPNEDDILKRKRLDQVRNADIIHSETSKI